VSLVVVGLNHRNAPVELLERMAVPARALPKALHTLTALPHASPPVAYEEKSAGAVLAIGARDDGPHRVPVDR